MENYDGFKQELANCALLIVCGTDPVAHKAWNIYALAFNKKVIDLWCTAWTLMPVGLSLNAGSAPTAVRPWAG